MIVYKSISRAVLIDVICLLPLLESSSSASGSVLIDRIGLLKITMLVIMLILVMSLLPLSCDCHVAMILAIVGRLWSRYNLAYCLLPMLILVMAPIILWLSCGNDSCDSGLIVILVTTWPIAHQQDGSGQSDTTHAKSKKKKEQKILIDQAKRTRAT